MAKFTWIRKTGSFIKRHASTILSFAAAGGTIATGVLAAKERPKSDERIRELKERKPEAGKIETVANGAVAYLPAITIGGLTIASIFASDILNKKQQAELAMLCAIATDRYNKFKQKIADKHGEEEVVEVQKEVDKEIHDEYVHREFPDWCNIKLDKPDQKRTWIFHGERFERYEREIMDAEYHLNRNFVLRGYATVNEFKEFLGLDQFPQEDDEVGWQIEDEYYWVDFYHKLNEDGTVEIMSTFPPYDFNDDSDPAPWEP